MFDIEKYYIYPNKDIIANEGISLIKRASTIKEYGKSSKEFSKTIEEIEVIEEILEEAKENKDIYKISRAIGDLQDIKSSLNKRLKIEKDKKSRSIIRMTIQVILDLISIYIIYTFSSYAIDGINKIKNFQ